MFPETEKDLPAGGTLVPITRGKPTRCFSLAKHRSSATITAVDDISAVRVIIIIISSSPISSGLSRGVINQRGPPPELSSSVIYALGGDGGSCGFH